MGLKLFNRINEAKRRAEIAKLFVQQQRDDMLNEFDWTPGISIEDAGLEEYADQPVFGSGRQDQFCDRLNGGICEVVEWFYDGENPKLEMN